MGGKLVQGTLFTCMKSQLNLLTFLMYDKSKINLKREKHEGVHYD
jgi:hypothetical protein